MNLQKKTIKIISFLLLTALFVSMFLIPADALRCRHTGGKQWVYHGNTLNHIQVCNDCGARLKTESHDVTKDEDWDFVYLDADVDMSGGGTHQQICKKCGYTFYNEHYYVKKTVMLNGANHPNVLICNDPKCGHVKEYDEHGLISNHVYYTKYVNFDDHVTLCGYCGCAPGMVFQNSFKKVEHVDSSKLDTYYVFANNGAYKQYKYLSDAEKKLYKTYYTLELGFRIHQAGPEDYKKHNWYEVRNASSHWTECHGCHATYDKAGHNFETYVDEHQGWAYEKITYCRTCGWVKSIKYTNEKNDKGKWINIKELLDTQQKILDYNGCPDEQPKPGHGGDITPCTHPAYYTVYTPEGERRVDNFYYLYIGGRHEKRCGSCNATLSTESCSCQTETFKQVCANYLQVKPWIVEQLGADYIDWLYVEDYFKSGHYLVCSTCGGKKLVSHNWTDTTGSHSTGDVCKLVCKDCGFTKTYRQRSEGSDDPTPHTYLTYQNNYWLDANMEIHDPDDGCCSYTFVGGESTRRHRAKCEVCGFTHIEQCDTLGWVELPGQPGKHLQFCSKCGGGRTVVDCGAEYVAGDNLPVGFHAVKCPTCEDVYISKTPCDYVLDEKNTDAFIHTYKCAYCDYEWHAQHTRKTIKTNVVPATADADGHYDLVTYCEICNTEITRTTITIPKTDNPTALANVIGVYLTDTRNNAHMGSGSSYLNGTIVMDGVSEYLANNSAALLNGAVFDPSHDFWVNGMHVTPNGTTRIVLYANALMTVTDYTQDEDDLDGDDDRDEYTSMTATVTFTYSAFYVTTVNGVDYRDTSPVYDGDGHPILDLPLDLSGAPITMTLPLLTGLSSFQTMFVRQTVDGGATYTTYLGDFHSDYGLATVTFRTEDGFDGTFLFVPTEHWLEHHERQEPTDLSDGNIEYWYSKNQDKYFSDILCEHEITKAQTYINANTYVISFAPGGGSGSVPAPVTGVHKQEDVTLPDCTCTNPGYVFYGWSDGDWTYKAGSLYTVRGDAVLTARWHLPGDTMCHITFHPNAEDAEGAMDEQTCRPGDVIRLQENGYTREGYTFYGWSSTPARQVPPYAFDKDALCPETDLDLYAIWCPTYYVIFDANGGEGEMEPQAYESAPLLPGEGWYVQYAGLVPNTYTRDGYKFKFWATNPDGSGSTYTDGGVSPMDTTDPQNVTLYAIWEQTRFTVTFDANCGDATGQTPSVQFEKGIWDVIPQCTFERAGYVFVKWAENPDGTGNTAYTPGLLRTFAQDKTLYAVWQKTRTVTFIGNGADNAMPAQVVTEGTSTRLSDFALARDGYATVTYCWNTEPDGSGTKYYNGQFVTLTADLTLYAQWKKTRFTITYDANDGSGETCTQTVEFVRGGNSSACPRCSADYTLTVGEPDLTVRFCSCCGLAVVNKDGGETTGLAVRSYASLADYTLCTSFDDLASLHEALIALYPEKDSTVVSGAETEEFAAYLALYEKAAGLMNDALAGVTKTAGYSFDTTAVVGIDDGFILTPGAYEYTFAETLGALSRLFGIDDPALFTQYLSLAVSAYAANEAGAATDSTSNRLKYEGAVYTTNGSFVFPYAFRCEILDKTLLLYLIVDADGGVYVWLSDLDALFAVTFYGLTLPEDIEAELEVYGRCSLYENPRALDCAFSRDLYTFSKWNTAPDGTGSNYTPQSSTFYSSSLSDDLTLYAVWTPDFFSVSFDANGGEGSMAPITAYKNVAATLPACTFTREGYVFIGWNTYVSSYASYSDGGEITRSAATTLYAVWKRKVTVTFDANGGYGSMAPQEVGENTYTKLQPNAFLNNTKSFNYWSLSPDGARAYYDGANVRTAEDLTLYAIWKDKTDVSALITFDNVEREYTGEAPALEATIDFTGSGVSAGINAGFSFAYFAGAADPSNLLPEAPTEIGVYTVRAFYDDYRNKGYADALLTITKAQRNLTPASSLLLLYGDDKQICLHVSDADGSAAQALVIESGDPAVVTERAGESYLSGELLTVAVAYEGEGYTKVFFSLPETAHYYADETSIVVISKNGYNVNVDAPEGGSVSADRPTAQEGEQVNVSATPAQGFTLEAITVTCEEIHETVDLTDDSFTMPAFNVTVGARFTQNDYAINCAPVAGVTYGELPETAHFKDIVTLTAQAGEGRAVRAFIVGYGDTFVTVLPDKDGVFTCTMPANDVTVTAVIGTLYPVSVDQTTGGSVQVLSALACEDATVALSVEAAQGYTAGAVTYTANGVTRALALSVDETGEPTYTFVMPQGGATVRAEFIPDASLGQALSAVSGNAGSEAGQTQARVSAFADDAAAEELRAAALAVGAELNCTEVSQPDESEKAAALAALAQAGLISVTEQNGSVVVKDGENADAAVRIVEKTYMDVVVKDYEESGNNVSLTFEITPMKQLVATAAPDGTTLNESNSAPLGAPQELPTNEPMLMTVGIPAWMATAAGGAGAALCVRHTHDGVTYEYPALIGGSAQEGYTASFENPNGYSEFTVCLNFEAVASFVSDGRTYSFISFADAIAAALEKNATVVTMYRMPIGEDAAEITRAAALTFTAAPGCEDLIDFDALYSDRLLPGVDILRRSSEAQLAERIYVYEDASLDPFDLNRDGEVTVTDVTALLDYIAGKSGSDFSIAGDFTGDGSVDVTDVTALLNHIAGY